MSSTIAVYGMGVMGQNLALNIANHGFEVSVGNRSTAKVDETLARVTTQKVTGCYSPEELVASLSKPRVILLMITAGKAVDAAIDQFIPLLDEGDVLVDCGNSYFKDTIRRTAYCKQKGIHFFGAGVSGGELGALNGPSIMPGGDRDVYVSYIEPVFNAIAAKASDGQPCVGYIGEDGSGHYVKMVHNGIEYGDMQIICEAYQIMKNVLKMSCDEMQKVFEKWNQGRLKSYLIEITSKILAVKDEKTGKPIVDVILDRAGQKGTGKWTSMEGLDLGVAIPTIGQSVFARCMSAIKDERVNASKIFNERPAYVIDREQLLADLEKAVYSAKIISYAQGFALLKEAAREYNWHLNYGEISMMWREGCIIRAEFLHEIRDAFDREPDLVNLMLADKFCTSLKNDIDAFRRVVIAAVGNGLYSPALTSALGYYDGYRSENLPANLLQAQRDFFGSHTYQRVDADPKEFFHTIWEEE